MNFFFVQKIPQGTSYYFIQTSIDAPTNGLLTILVHIPKNLLKIKFTGREGISLEMTGGTWTRTGRKLPSPYLSIYYF